MKKPSYHLLSGVSLAVLMASGQAIAVDSVAEALESGTAYGDFRLRYENVDQDNPLDEANALTLRSRLGYTTGAISGFSATLEFEDSRTVAGQDEFSTPGNVVDYSVVADPKSTEIDQSFLQYKADMVTIKAGRQVLTLDNHRFVGHVGWRQDRQTFDALSAVVTPVENLTLTYAFLDQRNRILAEEADFNSEDHLLNASFNTSLGTLTGYAYLLDNTDAEVTYDIFGVRFAGSTEAGEGLEVLYAAEYATQEREDGAFENDTDYMLLEGGVVVSGITLKAGYEVLGSDDGERGFQTPLATLHKFNGWADIFLGTPNEGLVDMYLSAGGKVAGGKWAIVYHDFEADDASDDVDDLGDEIDLLYATKFGNNYNAGIKYAAYTAGDEAAGKVDTDKLWVWVGASF